MSNWRPQCDQPLLHTFSNLIEPEESKRPELLPNLRGSESLVLVSDYAGQGKECPYQVLTFLLTDMESVRGDWNTERLKIRRQHLPDGRRLEFKSLNDQRKQKAFLPFLQAVNQLNGIVLVVAIDKTVKAFTERIPMPNPANNDSEPHNPLAWEKLLRVATFAAVIVSGLGTPEQEIHWIMDDDDIIANDALNKSTAVTCRMMLQTLCPTRTATTFFAAASEFDDDGLAEDLVSIVDIGGGAIAETMAALGSEKMPRSTSLMVPILTHLSTKTQLINIWLSDSSSRLKKINVSVRPHSNGQMLVSMGQVRTRIGEPSFCAPFWTPMAKGWKNSSRWWDLRQ